MSKILEYRLYNWAMNEAVNEARTEFSRLSQMNSSGINQRIWAIEILGLDKQLALQALIKVCSKNLMDLIDITVSEEEEKLAKTIIDVAMSPEVRQMVEKRLSQLVPIGKRKVKQLLKQFWMEEFDTKIPTNLCIATKINEDFFVETYLDCDTYSCEYFHHIIWIDKANNAEIKINLLPINLHECLGLHVGGWCFLSEENAVASIQQMVSYCKDFINYAPQLVSGLEAFAEKAPHS